MNTTTSLKYSTKLGMALLAAGLLFAVPNAQAQANMTKLDVKFLHDAAQGGLTEVKLGEMASKKGTTDVVKEFGEQMVKDHGAMNDRLKALAASKGVALSADLDEKHQALVDKLSGLPGSEFDDTYVIDMVKAHESDLKAFQDELGQTQDVDIQNFVTKSIPVIEAHLKHVAGMQKAPASPNPDVKN